MLSVTKVIVLIVLISNVKLSNLSQFTNCSEILTSNVQSLINDYFTWRNIKLLIMISNEPGCESKMLKMFLSSFLKSNFFLSCQTPAKFLEIADDMQHTTIGIIIFDNFLDYNNLTYSYYDEIFKLSLIKDNLALLLITQNNTNIFDKMWFVNLSFNSDLVIASKMKLSLHKVTDDNLIQNRYNEVNNSSDNQINKGVSYDLLQVYKIRKEVNASLTVNPIGIWYDGCNMSDLRSFLQVEKRINFNKHPFKFGKKNSTLTTTNNENILEDDSDEEKLIEVANYLALFFNSSIDITYFQKLGFKETNGIWTDLFKAVINEDVDLGLERIIKTSERYWDMDFTHKILNSMRNIYIKPQESNELRDIFLVPFGSRLIFCVVATGIICTLMMVLINKILIKHNSPQGVKKNNKDAAEATIWCIGIFTMQGSVWQPNSCSGNIVLITSLIFALLIFNAYSAFITSILSVEVMSIKSIEDLLKSDYNIGYTRNSQDEIYLRSMNDTHLQQIYLRGYLDNTVNNVTEGLLKTTKGHYGFFASANMARKELQVVNNYRCNYDIIEIPLTITKNTIAFPLSKNSHYKKIINLGIIKMYETGIYKYMHSLIVPDLPSCKQTRIFRSAHLPDLSTAFAILIMGVLTSITIMIGECMWKKKERIIHLFHSRKST